MRNAFCNYRFHGFHHEVYMLTLSQKTKNIWWFLKKKKVIDNLEAFVIRHWKALAMAIRHLQIWAGMERDKYVEVYWILIIEM